MSRAESRHFHAAAMEPHPSPGLTIFPTLEVHERRRESLRRVRHQGSKAGGEGAAVIMSAVVVFWAVRVFKVYGRENLAPAERPDSQDLCFLAGEDYRNFLQRNATDLLVPGQIVTRDGKSLGEHDGLANYTIGQRKGLGVASPIPLYVLGKNAITNTLVVGTQDELGSSELTARDVNWISGEVPSEPFRAEVKIRYTAKEAEALVTPMNGNQVQVQFDAPQRDITAGQAAVFFFLGLFLMLPFSILIGMAQDGLAAFEPAFVDELADPAVRHVIDVLHPPVQRSI